MYALQYRKQILLYESFVNFFVKCISLFLYIQYLYEKYVSLDELQNIKKEVSRYKVISVYDNILKTKLYRQSIENHFKMQLLYLKYSLQYTIKE